MNQLEKDVSLFLQATGINKTYWLGFSGGLDSHVLLQLLAEVRQEVPFDLRTLHVHHGLSPQADHWVLHCQKVCSYLDVPFTVRHVKIEKNAKLSVEEALRNKRYDVFSEYIQKNHVLLTAHHQDDQTETFLLQLLRGAGLKGLAAMPRIKSFAAGEHARPLLSFSRQQLAAFADEKKLKYIDDESNLQIQYDRNFIRHTLLPIIVQRWPGANAVISRSADHCGEAQSLLDYFGQDLLREVQGGHPNTLSVEKLKGLDSEQQKLVFRMWLSQAGIVLPNTKKLKSMQQSLLSAKRDRNPEVTWGKVTIRRFKDDIFILEKLVSNNQSEMSWDLHEALLLPGVGSLVAVKLEDFADPKEKVFVRFRQGGERLKQRGQTKSLKKLLQEWSVPPWQRSCLPLIYVEKTLVAIPGYFLDKQFAEQFRLNEIKLELKIPLS